MRIGLIHGLIGGVLAIALSLIFYATDRQTILGTAGLLPFLLVTITGIPAMLTLRRAQGGQLALGDAMGAALLAYAVGALLYGIFLMVFMLKIDPALFELSKQRQMEVLNEQLKLKNIDQKVFDMQAVSIQNADWTSLLKGNIFSFFLFAILALVIDLVAAGILRREGNRSA